MRSSSGTSTVSTASRASWRQFFDVCDAAGLTDLASVSGRWTSRRHDGRFLARILGAVASKESDDKSRRIRRKHEELAQSGAPTGGGVAAVRLPRRPRDASTPTRPRSSARLSRRVLAGDSLRSIATDWQRRAAIRTARAAPGRSTTLHRMLVSPRICRASASTAARSSAQAQWEAILTPDETARLRAYLSRPRAHDRPRPPGATS